MLMPTIVPAYSAILVLIFVFLSFRVIQMRNAARIGLGTGNNPAMERRIRVHGNFAEYVPLALLLLTFMEIQSQPRIVIHVLCIALIIARIMHAVGVTPVEESLPMRIAGAVTTFGVLVIASLMLLFYIFLR